MFVQGRKVNALGALSHGPNHFLHQRVFDMGNGHALTHTRTGLVFAVYNGLGKFLTQTLPQLTRLVKRLNQRGNGLIPF